ncbi:interleukin-12 receptor subunit beta-2 [Dendrobates tinctorius]|uniref:interleukin-12 receptor subunit beta-2 n=1 Tax=Dendrobates tinctorius TaxID=92724 RepID=UPI003CCA6CFF
MASAIERQQSTVHTGRATCQVLQVGHENFRPYKLIQNSLLMEKLWFPWMTLTITVMWSPKISRAESCPAAVMKASPSAVIHHGHPINLTCTLTGHSRPCNLGSRGEMKIEIQKTTMPGRVKKDSVIVQDLRPPPGATVYECWKCKMLCVITVFVGYPPDKPNSVTCEQEGELGNISCSWESGRETLIATTWILQLLQKTHIVTVSSLYSSQTNQSAVLPVSISVGDEFTVLVRASNDLGENISMPHTFSYTDAVKPHPPSDVTVTCDTSHSCTVTIHTHQDVRHFWLRYRIPNESAWKQVEILNHRSRTVHNLRPLSQYELQAACKYVIDRGKWSNWSDVITLQTPEDAPHGNITAWYKLERSNTVTIFWKYMNLSEFRGRIQFYQVTIQDSERPGVYVQNSTDTWLSRNIDTDGCVIAVSAHNSMGSSCPTYISVSTRSHGGFPAPTNVISRTSGPEDITLHWELPYKTESDDDQVVTWRDPTEMDQSHTNWIIVPKQNRSVTISGHLRPQICYQFSVYLLRGGRAGRPGITRGSTQQTAPLSGPDFTYKMHKNRSVLVTWQETPAEEQMGCITHYSIYLRAATQGTRIIHIPSHQSSLYQYEIENLENNVHYSLEMTSSNGAGESPPSPLLSAYVRPDEKSTDPEDTMVVEFVVALLVIGFLISILIAKQRLQSLSRLILHWCRKPIPDPANCEWAKECVSSQEKRGILPNAASSISDNEIETLEIEEIDSEDEAAPAVFSYKIGLPIIRLAQEERKIPSHHSCGDVLSDQSMKPVQDCFYKSLQPTYPPSDYVVHQDLKSSNYLGHHEIRASDYLEDHEVRASDYLGHHEIRASDFLGHHEIRASDYLEDHEVRASDYLEDHEVRASDYLEDHEVRASDYLGHHEMSTSVFLGDHEMRTSDYLGHHEMSTSVYLGVHEMSTSDYLGHHEMSTSVYLGHHEMGTSDYLGHHERRTSDYLGHHEMGTSDYLGHHEMGTSDYLGHHEMGTSDYLGHHERRTSDYLGHHEMGTSDYLGHHERRTSDYLGHHEMGTSDYLGHHERRTSDYLGHIDIETSSYLDHQNIQASEKLAYHEMKQSPYLLHSKEDYLPPNQFTSMEDHSKYHKDQFHHQLLLPAGAKTNNTISLDSVVISCLQGENCEK